jgi:signal transduction histidine kinase
MQEKSPIRVLVVDDEKVIRDGCERALTLEGYQIDKAENGAIGVAMLEKEFYDVVLLDLMMPGIDGFSVLRWVKDNRPDVEVIVITGFATVAKAVAAMKEGACDFVGKPFTPDYLRLVVKRAAEKRQLMAEAVKLREEKTLDIKTIVEEQSRLKSVFVFSCMVNSVIVTNREGIVVLHNPAAIKFLEIQTDPVIGKPLADSIQDPTAMNMVNEVIETGVSIAREFPPGTISRTRYLRARSAPVLTATEKILGAVTVFEDITTHKEMDRLKSEFVSMVTHELRAPLASIEQMIHAIRRLKPEAEERRTHFIERISSRVRDQLQLVENLLNLSRLETGTIVFNLEPVNGDELLKEVAELVRPRAESKNIDLEYTPCPEPWWTNADQNYIRLVFTNLIDNAVKYTPDGGRVTVASATGGSLAKITVADTGVGIKEEDLPNIFDRFFRVRGDMTRKVTGSGLGLSLVRSVIKAHNGYIDVASEPDEGSTFTVSLPLLGQPPSNNA